MGAFFFLFFQNSAITLAPLKTRIMQLSHKGFWSFYTGFIKDSEVA
jgi:hypothetical protein